MISDGASSGFFITAGSFTRDAIEFAQTHTIDPIDGTKLIKKFFESSQHPLQTDQYRSMCRQCGEIVDHRLRTPEAARCRNGHVVEPTLTLDNLLAGKPILGLSAEQALVPNKAIIRAFRNAGFGTVSQGDIGMLQWWVRQGYWPMPGSQSIRVKHTRLYHKSQLRPLTLEEKAARKAQSEAALARSEAKAAIARAVMPVSNRRWD
jgi:hypothetical protein